MKIVGYDAKTFTFTKYHVDIECFRLKGKHYIQLTDSIIKKLDLEGCKACVRRWDSEKYKFVYGGKL